MGGILLCSCPVLNRMLLKRGTRGGERGAGKGEREAETGRGEQETGNATGNGEQGTRNGERGTASGGQGAGNDHTQTLRFAFVKKLMPQKIPRSVNNSTMEVCTSSITKQ